MTIHDLPQAWLDAMKILVGRPARVGIGKDINPATAKAMMLRGLVTIERICTSAISRRSVVLATITSKGLEIASCHELEDAGNGSVQCHRCRRLWPSRDSVAGQCTPFAQE